MSGDYSGDNRVLTWKDTITTQGEEVFFPGTNGVVITAPDSADWAFTGPFCIELFGLKLDDVSIVNGLISHYNASGNDRSWAFDYRGDESPKKFRTQLSNNGTDFTLVEGNYTASNGVAMDVCLERDGSNTVRIYVDGVMVGSGTHTGTLFNSSQLLDIGQGLSQTASALAGSLKAVRITAAARYASDGGYTVPSLPLPTQGA